MRPGGGQTNGPGQQLPLRPSVQPPPKNPRTDWQLGLSVAYDAELLEVRSLLATSVALMQDVTVAWGHTWGIVFVC